MFIVCDLRCVLNYCRGAFLFYNLCFLSDVCVRLRTFTPLRTPTCTHSTTPLDLSNATKRQRQKEAKEASCDPLSSPLYLHYLNIFPPVSQHPPMRAVLPSSAFNDDIRLVGGTVVGGAPVPMPAAPKKRGQRGPDKYKRRAPTCRSCKANAGIHFLTCKGRAPRGRCQFFDRDGNPL
jgi:hypothetical protein